MVCVTVVIGPKAVHRTAPRTVNVDSLTDAGDLEVVCAPGEDSAEEVISVSLASGPKDIVERQNIAAVLTRYFCTHRVLVHTQGIPQEFVDLSTLFRRNAH
jgi:hypothetical protein